MAFITVQSWQVSTGKNLNGVHDVEQDAYDEAAAFYQYNPSDTYYFPVTRLVEVPDEEA